jgi:hypothetical protein
VTLRGELEEPEEQGGEVGVIHVLLAGRPVRPDAQAFGLGVALEGVEVEDGGGGHQAGDGGEESGVALVLEGVQHLLKERKKNATVLFSSRKRLFFKIETIKIFFWCITKFHSLFFSFYFLGRPLKIEKTPTTNHSAYSPPD